MSTLSIVKTLKENQEDFEWYPTTNEILDSIKPFIPKNTKSILDLGAGDGRSLTYLSNGLNEITLYAVEKSKTLVKKLDKSIYIIGSDFNNITLIDKDIDVIFCNPPYSHYEEWTSKIIEESFSPKIFLVIPERWKNSKLIQTALEIRKAKTKIIGNFDFYNADRKARAIVDVIQVSITNGYNEKIDPFEVWFEKSFSFSKVFNEHDEKIKKIEKEFEEKRNSLKLKKTFIPNLVDNYNSDLEKYHKNFKAILNIDIDILKEIEVSPWTLKELIKNKIKNLKSYYWKILFNELDVIVNRLCVSQRKNFLNKITKNISVDFNEENIYNIILWVIKNANEYYDDQLKELMYGLVDSASVKLYKSNARVFKAQDWKYIRKDEREEYGGFKLDHRIVLHKYLAIEPDWGKTKYHLSRYSSDFFNDICTIAGNIGYSGFNRKAFEYYKEWESGKRYEIKANKLGKEIVLFDVRIYKNGNIHIRFDSHFMLELNILMGKLMKWIHSKEQACIEMNLSQEEVNSVEHIFEYGNYNAINEIKNKLLQLED